MSGLLAVFAELERDFIRERVKAGLEEARRKVKSLGRPGIGEVKKKKKVQDHTMEEEYTEGRDIQAHRCFEKIPFQDN